MEATGDIHLAQRRAHNMEHDEMEMNMRMRARKAQAGKPGNQQYPRVIIHVPEWMSQFTAISRGLKLVLGGIAVVACVGTYLVLSDIMPDTPKLKSGAGLSAIKGVDKEIPQLRNGAPPPAGTTIPLALSNLAELSLPRGKSDIPFLLEVPFSGDAIISSMIGRCAGLVQALNSPRFIGESNPMMIEVVKDTEVGNIMNVDTFSARGIANAKANHLVYTGQVDVIFSPRLYDAAGLFASDHRGRVFTIIRHPIERINFYFNLLSNPDDPFYDPSLAGIDIDTYAKKEDRPEFNYLTKLFSNKLQTPSNELKEYDLNTAKEVIRRKVLIGLESNKPESIHRIQQFFDMSFEDQNSDDELCGKGLPFFSKSLDMGPPIAPSDPVWDSLMEKNSLDMDLFKYAETLFQEQRELFVSP